MKNVNLGRAHVALDEYASQANAVLGIRGSGKTYTGTAIAEQLLDANVPIVGLDPIGMWRYLRVPLKEGGKAYPVVVAGGQHGDIPLPVHGAAQIMRAAMRDGVSIIFDLYDVNLSKRAWRDIVTEVVKVLLFENKQYGLRHVFIEEAAEFVPQRVGPDQGMVYSMVERLARMGGNAQLGLTLINQRAEEVNKAVLDLCDCLLLHRQKGRNSLLNLAKWLDVASVSIAKDVAATVPMLANGECYVWKAGDETPTRTKIPTKNTFHPDRKKMQLAIAAEAARVDVGVFAENLKAQLETLVEEADARDPDKLLARIRELERGGGVSKADLNLEFERGRATGRDELKAEIAGPVQTAQMAVSALKEIVAVPDGLRQAVRGVGAQPGGGWPAGSVASQAKDAQRGVNNHARKVVDGLNFPQGELAIMKAVAQYPDGADRDELSVLTGYKRSTRNAYIARLADKGFIEDRGERVVATQAGIKALGSNYEPLPTGMALRQHWMHRLPEGERAVLSVAIDHYPRDIDRGEVSAATGYKRSTRNAYISRLVSRRLLETIGDGVKASGTLFS